MKVIPTLAILMVVAFAVAGCATPQTQELVQAEHAYTEASTDPTVTQNAALTLQEAQKALNQAKNADDVDVQRHYAYLAGKKVELARVQADNAQTQQQVAELEMQQKDYLLQLRQGRTEQAQQRAQQAEQELRAYRTEAMQSKETDAGIVLTLTDVVFALDQAQLKSGAERGLSKLADFLKSNPDRNVLVEGFTDSTGSDAYNQELSEERARSVAQALEAEGISPARITTRGLGERYPLAPNNTEAGRQQNRRVEITILNEDRGVEDAGRGQGT